MPKLFDALEKARKEAKGSKRTNGEATSPLSLLQPEIVKNMLTLFESIESLLPGRKSKIIQFVASREHEGTSTVVRDFAVVCAEKLDRRVLLLDADNVAPSHHAFFGIKPAHALDSVISNNEPLHNAFNPVGDSKLTICFAGLACNTGTDVFDAPRMESVWELLRQTFDYVLVDTPAVTVSPDYLSLTRRMDGTILVVEADRTRWPIVDGTRDKLVKAGGNILGTVFNKRHFYIPTPFYRRL